MVPPLRPDRPKSTDRPIPADRAKGVLAPRRRTSRAESARTQERILDAAEELYVEVGFGAASLRAIAARAGVNLASTHYHFGSKEGLLEATIERRVNPVNVARIQRLESLEAEVSVPSVEEILEVFFLPLAGNGMRSTLSKLMARLFCEPESMSKPLIEKVFGPTCDRFIAALGKALPDQSVDELRWRFHFVSGSMVHLLNFDRPLLVPASSAECRDGLQRLLSFAAAGMRQGSSERGEDPR